MRNLTPDVLTKMGRVGLRKQLCEERRGDAGGRVRGYHRYLLRQAKVLLHIYPPCIHTVSCNLLHNEEEYASPSF